MYEAWSTHSDAVDPQIIYIEDWKIRTRQVSEYIDILNFLRVTRGLARIVVYLILILTSKNCSTCLRFKLYYVKPNICDNRLINGN